MRSIIVAFLLASTTSLASAAEPSALPRSTPEAQGIPSSAILAFVEAAEEKLDALHSLMVVRHGHVVAEGWWEPYQRDDLHVLFSLSKSFASTGIGLAIAEGRLSLDDTVLSIFPEDAPAEPSENLKAMRVRDLLSMSTGQHAEAIEGFDYWSSDERLTRVFLGRPVAHKPGTLFVYNTPASYMLSAIVQKTTGTKLVDYLGPRLFDPLGIQNPRWDESADGVSLGGFGLNVTTEDIARFGQLYLQKGKWQGEQLLPAEWVEAATARQVSNGSAPDSDWEQGYGYQFWRCRHGVYRGDGAFGQYCIVLPENDGPVQAVGLEIGEGTTLLLRMGDEDRRFPVGSGTWERNGSFMIGGRLFPESEEPVATSGAWTDDNTYVVKACLYRTPFCATMRLEFAGDVLLFDQEMNVGFEPREEQPQLVGRLQQ